MSVPSVPAASGAEQSDVGRTEVQELFRAHAAYVAGFIRKLGVARADVDDLVQNVFVTAHRKGGYRPGKAGPRTWLASIAVGHVRNHRRWERRHPTGSLDAGAASIRDERRSGGALEARSARTQLEHALSALSDPQRLVFVLYEVEEYTCPEIAEMCDVALGTVHSRLHAARRIVRDAFAGSRRGENR